MGSVWSHGGDIPPGMWYLVVLVGEGGCGLAKGRTVGEGQEPLGGLSGGKGACNWAGGVVIGIQVCSMHRFLNPIRIPGNKIARHSRAK